MLVAKKGVCARQRVAPKEVSAGRRARAGLLLRGLAVLATYLDLQSCNFEHYGITTAHVQTAFMKLVSGKGVRSIDLPAKLVCESIQAGRVLTPEDAVSGHGRKHEGEGYFQ